MEEATETETGTNDMKKKRWERKESGLRVFILLCLLHTAFFLILAAFCTLWQAGRRAGVGTGQGQRIREHKKQGGEEEEIKKVNKWR